MCQINNGDGRHEHLTAQHVRVDQLWLAGFVKRDVLGVFDVGELVLGVEAHESGVGDPCRSAERRGRDNRSHGLTKILLVQ